MHASFIIVRFLVLFALIRLLMETESPVMCAGIYTFINIFFAIFTGGPLGIILLSALIAGALALLYFWVLDKLVGKGAIFWIAAIVGAAIGLI